MFRYLLNDNGIDLEDYDLEPRDALFIEEIICGTREKDRKGREKAKFFLYGKISFFFLCNSCLI